MLLIMTKRLFAKLFFTCLTLVSLAFRSETLTVGYLIVVGVVLGVVWFDRLLIWTFKLASERLRNLLDKR